MIDRYLLIFRSFSIFAVMALCVSADVFAAPISLKEDLNLDTCLAELASLSGPLEDLKPSQKRQWDLRVAIYFFQYLEFPVRTRAIDGYVDIGVDYDRWIGTRHFSENSRHPSFAIHKSRLKAFLAVRRVFENLKVHRGFSEANRQEVLQVLDAQIFPLLSLAKRKKHSDSLVFEFIIQNKRWPLSSRVQNDFKPLGFERKQWVGSGEYGQHKSHLRFHASEIKAWRAVLKLLQDFTPTALFTSLDKERWISRLNFRIAYLSLSPANLKVLIDEWVVQFVLKNKKAPTAISGGDFDQYGINYDQWSATVEYRPKGSMHSKALSSSPEEAWSGPLNLVNEKIANKASDEELQALEGALDILNKRIDLMSSLAFEEVIENISNSILDFCLTNRKLPVYDEMNEMHTDISRFFGTGIYRKGGTGQKLAYFENAEAAWTHVLNRLLEVDFEDQVLRQFLLEEVRVKINKASNRLVESEKSKKQKSSEADLKVAEFIVENERLPTQPSHTKRQHQNDFNDIGVNHNQWAGTGSYNSRTRSGKRGVHAHLAFHSSRKEAFQAVRGLIADESQFLIEPKKREKLLGIIGKKFPD